MIKAGPILEQARSQACVSGVAKLYWRNHVMQNLRAYFILCYDNQMEQCVYKKD